MVTSTGNAVGKDVAARTGKVVGNTVGSSVVERVGDFDGESVGLLVGDGVGPVGDGSVTLQSATDVALKHPWVTGEKAKKESNSQMVSTLKELNAWRKFQQGVEKIVIVNRFAPKISSPKSEGHAGIHDTYDDTL